MKIILLLFFFVVVALCSSQNQSRTKQAYAVYFKDDQCRDVGIVTGAIIHNAPGLNVTSKGYSCQQELTCRSNPFSSECQRIDNATVTAVYQISREGIIETADGVTYPIIPYGLCLPSSFYPHCHFSLFSERQIHRFIEEGLTSSYKK